MKTEWNYGNIRFKVDSAKHEIYINGDLASGAYAPIGGVVVDMEDETPDICEVITNIGATPQEKVIVYGAPLSLNEPVIILGEYVIPSSLMVRNDLEEDYEVYKAMLEGACADSLDLINDSAAIGKKHIDTVKDEAVGELQQIADNLIDILEKSLGAGNTAIANAAQSAIAEINALAGSQRLENMEQTLGELDTALDVGLGEVM